MKKLFLFLLIGASLVSCVDDNSPNLDSSVVVSPSFSPGDGTYSNTQLVTITTSTSGASIRFTTNGSTPTPTTGTVYSSPVSISTTITLKAIAYKDINYSPVTTATYTLGGKITPTLFQEFHSWSGSTSPDGIWRIAGVWQGSGGTLDPANATFTETYPGESSTGFLSLTQTPLVGGIESGAEVQTLTTYGYGYYECRMKVAHVSGVVASFFWIQAPDYGSLEFDHEFLTDESWLNSASSGIDHFSTHPNINVNHLKNLSFNPSLAFHRYGILWQAGRLDYTIDGVIVHTVTNSTLNTNATGFIMMNTYSSGNRNWGGGPPSQNATTVYDWIKFYPNVTSVPNGGNYIV